MARIDKRKNEDLRKISFTKDYIKHPLASILSVCGETKVICSVSFDEGVPSFLEGQGKGWVTAEYEMHPYSTHSRMRRERDKGIKGRSQEIQRLIGRALRAAVDFELLGENTLKIDCDVIQADGGTRVTSINGAYVALELAVKRLIKDGILEKSPIKNSIAATSIGIIEDEILLDLCYEEDSAAEVDLNVVATGSGKLIEIQGTAEGQPFSRKEFDKMLDLALKGIKEVGKAQKKAI